MDLFSIVSSSSGNCYVYRILGKYFIVDLGVSYRGLKNSLSELNIDIKDVCAVFITHEHIDHVKGLRVFSKNNDIKIFSNSETFGCFDFEDKNFLQFEDKLVVGKVLFEKIVTSHDAANSFAIKISCEGYSHVHMTDTGYIKKEVLDFITGADSYLLESNYEDELIMNNERYPFNTKKRIMSSNGHLSNRQCCDYFDVIRRENTKKLILGHLSVNNNEHSVVRGYYHDIDLIILEPYNIVEVLDVW